MTTEMNNRSESEKIRFFTELTTELKRRGTNPGLHIMDNEASKR